jgi:hypothetical protein
MVVIAILRLVFLLLASYLGLFTLWKITEREHVENLTGFLDKILSSALIALYAGKVPEFLFSWGTFTVTKFVNPISGTYSWPMGVSVFLILLFFFVRTSWKDPFSLFDFGVIPLTLFLSVLFLFDVIESAVTYLFFNGELAPVYVIVKVLAVITFFAASRILTYFENQYRTYFWYRYRRNSAQTGFVTAVFLVIFGTCNAVLVLGDAPFALLSLPVLNIVLSLVIVVSGFVLLYIRSGRWR